MYKKTILNKEIKIEEDVAIITENTELKLTQIQLENKLRDVQARKSGIRRQNERLIEEYNETLDEETELKNILSELDTSEPIEKI